MKLLLATRNPGKIREFEAALAGLGLEVESLRNFSQLAEPEETGTSFKENACLKARYYSGRTGMPALCDDSGLVVDALGGAPGVQSARLAATERDRIERILIGLAAIPRSERTARFVCALCLQWPDGKRLEAEASVEGVIVEQPRGSGGFGYDPIFYYPPLGKTFAQLTTEEKNRVSHRARALAQLRRQLKVAPA